MKNEPKQDYLNEEIDLRVIYRLIKRRLNLIFGVLFLSTLFTTIYSYSVKPKWSGSFNIIVKKTDNFQSRSSSPSLGINLITKLSGGQDNATEKLILKSPFLLNPVFNYVKQYKQIKGDNTDKLTFQKWLKSDLKIEFEDDSSVLKVSYINTDKQLILKTLDLISQKYKDYSKRDKEKEITKTINYLEKQTELMKEKSLNSLKEFNEFSIQNGLGNIDGFVELGEKRGFSNSNERRNFLLKNGDFTNEFNSSSSFNDSSAGQRFSIQFARLEKYEDQYVDLSSKLKPNSKTLIVLKEKIENMRSSLKRPNKILLEYGKLKAEAERDQNILLTLEESLQIAKLNKINTPDQWEIISVPTINDYPFSPNKKKLVIISIIASSLAGLLLAMIKEKYLGLIFELNDLKLNIPYKFLEFLFKNDYKLNNIILEGILGDNSDKKMGIIYLSEDFFINENHGNLQIFDNLKNIEFFNLKNISGLKSCDEIVLLSESGKISFENLNKICKNLLPFQEKINGWFFIN